MNTTDNWVVMLESPYIQYRIKKSKETQPNYRPIMLEYINLYHTDIPTTVSYIEHIDSISLQSINSLYPDEYFPYLSAPEGGPFLDILQFLLDKKASISKHLFNPYYLSLPLLISRYEKNLFKPYTVSKSDMEYIASYLIFLQSNAEYQALLEQSQQDKNIQSLVLFSFYEQNSQPSLYWNQSIIDECFQKALNYRQAYQKDPAETLESLFGDFDATSLL